MIENAIIKNASFIYENRKLCFDICIFDGVSSQYVGCHIYQDETDRDEFGKLERFIFDLCECLEVFNSEQFNNSQVPIRIDHDNASGMARKIFKIGHFIKDQWVTNPQF